MGKYKGSPRLVAFCDKLSKTRRDKGSDEGALYDSKRRVIAEIKSEYDKVNPVGRRPTGSFN
ncbi:hypothetical protein F8153_08810 [Alkaliphilus serpentinus]|uniref:Uncharacterized protein n=1 Tax=Alkaliphilus serpentinus TaxID=1482731 RepID=A0A833HNH1_9FIRM|nr:hypothetical protein F8153_08810 [Alkaliphilus serpentinus]